MPSQPGADTAAGAPEMPRGPAPGARGCPKPASISPRTPSLGPTWLLGICRPAPGRASLISPSSWASGISGQPFSRLHGLRRVAAGGIRKDPCVGPSSAFLARASPGLSLCCVIRRTVLGPLPASRWGWAEARILRRAWEGALDIQKGAMLIGCGRWPPLNPHTERGGGMLLTPHLPR